MGGNFGLRNHSQPVGIGARRIIQGPYNPDACFLQGQVNAAIEGGRRYAEGNIRSRFNGQRHIPFPGNGIRQLADGAANPLQIGSPRNHHTRVAQLRLEANDIRKNPLVRHLLEGKLHTYAEAGQLRFKLNAVGIGDILHFLHIVDNGNFTGGQLRVILAFFA
ncbi:hypothetical protein D3C75_825020 [compost metagenome]